MQYTEELAAKVGVAPACAALSVPRCSLYRARRRQTETPIAERAPHPRALTAAEKETVRQELNSERFRDDAPREVYATLLDEGTYLCHWRTMYRILAEHNEVRERRNQLRHPHYDKPELVATAPNEIWSWDITKLLGPAKWTYYYLYVVLDLFSRYVVGWMLAERETAALAQELIAATCVKQHIEPEQLIVHADRGGPMVAKPLAWLLADLGVTKSHARPHTPDDNPYSEAQFRTLKYRPDYPKRFDDCGHAYGWARDFFRWYNDEHHHSALGLLTPADVHHGRADHIIAQRQKVLSAVYAMHPVRFVKGPPMPPQLPKAVWINPPNGEAKSPSS